MGKKSFIFIGLLLVTLYAYLVVSIKTDGKPKEQELASTKTKVIQPVIEEIQIIKEKLPVLKEDIEEVEIINDNRISIPAFGFISTVKANQIVAIMSDNDENGSLLKTIEEICSNQECIKDIQYTSDVIDSTWQEPISELLKLMTKNKIKDGSIFIERNTVKIEGSVDNLKVSKEFEKIITQIEAGNLKIENLIIKNYAVNNTKKETKDDNETLKIVGLETNNQKAKEKKDFGRKDDNLQQIKIDGILKKTPLLFYSKKSEIINNTKKALEKIIKIIKSNEYKELHVIGYTDTVGTKAFNLKLSQRRAKAVSDYLKQNGIQASKIKTMGLGEEKPKQKNLYDPKSRRVEILLVN